MTEDWKYRITKNSYNAVAEAFADKHSDPRSVIDLMKLFVKRIRKNGRILDAGCGPGRDAKVLSEMGFQVVGIDFSEEMVRVACNMTGLDIRWMDLRDLDFCDEQFDGIWANACFMHLMEKDVKLVLSELERIVRPGGVVFISKWKKDIEGLIRALDFEIFHSHKSEAVVNSPSWVFLYALKPYAKQLKLDFGCRMCAVVQVESEPLWTSADPAVLACNRHIIETDNFVVCLALGQIVPGYALLVSKLHVPCMGALSVRVWEELEGLKSLVRGLFEPKFGPLVFFEHGRLRESVRMDGAVVHAHMHAATGPPGFVEGILRKLPFQAAKGGVFSRRSFENEKSYMLIEDHSNNCYGFNPEVGLPPQYLRRYLAQCAGLQGQWNWRFHAHEDKINFTIDRLKE
jgi:SAM-dependent methyltransferase